MQAALFLAIFKNGSNFQKIFFSTHKNLVSGENTVDLSVDQFPNGMYFIEVSGESAIIKQKFIKE